MPDDLDTPLLHRPVLMREVLEHLAPLAGARVLDCTLGLGGHSAALLQAGARVVAIERDARARELAQRRLAAFADSCEIVAGTFADVALQLVQQGERFDAVLADLGVSSMQLDDEQRGFSMRSSVDADMRMGDGCNATALELIDRLSESELADTIYRYGEERLSRRIAPALKLARQRGITSASELAEVIRRVVPGHHPRHPAQRTFQALRIAVNDELGQLERLLSVLDELLTADGRAVVISFHSLEDRMVKTAFRAAKATGRFTAIAKHVVTASAEELAQNARAGSAKLRWARRAGAHVVKQEAQEEAQEAEKEDLS